MIRYRKHCLLQYIWCIPSTDCASPPWGKNIYRQTKNECLGGVKLKTLTTRTRPLQNLLRISWEILVNLGRPDSQNLLHNKSPAFYLSIYLFIYHLFIYLSFICLFVFSAFLSVCLSFFLSFFACLFVCLFACLLAWLFVCLFVCLFIYFFFKSVWKHRQLYQATRTIVFFLFVHLDAWMEKYNVARNIWPVQDMYLNRALINQLLTN